MSDNEELFEVYDDLHNLTNLQLLTLLDSITEQVMEILLDREEAVQRRRDNILH